MATFKFRIHGKSDPTNIYIQVSLGRGKVYERKTGYLINPKHWSKQGKPINPRDSKLKAKLEKLDSKLNKLKDTLVEKKNNAVQNKEVINGDWLRYQIDVIKGDISLDSKNYLTNHIQFIIDNADMVRKSNNKLGLSQNRIKGYKTFKNTILRFEGETNDEKSFLIKNIDTNFQNDFIRWLKNKNYSDNYIGKNIDNLKAVCNHAKSEGIEVSKLLANIKGFTGEDKDSEDIIILTEAEQTKIAETTLVKESLINARKWLLLGCRLGQRFSDLIRVNPDMIVFRYGIEVLKIKQVKTGKVVKIPLDEFASDMIKNDMPHPISNQKFNDYIKDICKAAEINTPTKGAVYLETETKDPHKAKTPGVYPKWQLVGSHVCRRSYASQHYGEMPTTILKNITGHKTEAMLLRYVGEDEDKEDKLLAKYILGKRNQKSENADLRIIKKVSNN